MKLGIITALEVEAVDVYAENEEEASSHAAKIIVSLIKDEIL